MDSRTAVVLHIQVTTQWFGQESKDLASPPLLWLLQYKRHNNGSSALWLEILKFPCPTLLVHIILALDFLASLAKRDFCNYGKVTITRMSPGGKPCHCPSARGWKGPTCRVLPDQALALPGSPPLIKDPWELAPCWAVLWNSVVLFLPALTKVENQARSG